MNDTEMLQITKHKVRQMFDDIPADVGVYFDTDDVAMEITLQFRVDEKNLMNLEERLGCMRADVEELVR